MLSRWEKIKQIRDRMVRTHCLRRMNPPRRREEHSACLGMENRSWEEAKEGGRLV